MRKTAKFALLVALLALTLSLFTACGKFKCDGCGETKPGSEKHKVMYQGEQYVLCDECNEAFQEILDLAKEYEEQLSSLSDLDF